MNVSALPAPNMEWYKIYGGYFYDHAYSVQQTLDGGYIFAGDSGNDAWLYKTDAAGNQIWEKTFGVGIAHAVLQITDGYIIAGEKSGQAWLLKTDLNGIELSSKIYSGKSFNSISALNDGYILAGNIPGTTHGQALLVRTDLDGNVVWEKQFGDDSTHEVAYSVKQTLDNGFIFVGKLVAAASESIYIVKTNDAGNLVWEKRGSNFPASYQAVDLTQDGGFIMAGRIADPSMGMLTKIDAAGNEIWIKYYGIFGTNRLDSVQSTADGGYIAAGMYNKQVGGIFSDHAWLIKTDADGNTAWDSQYKLWNTTAAYSVRQTTDGGYIMAGSSTGYTDGWLIKVGTDSPADLAITKTDSPDPILVGNPLTYTITVTNNGPAGATGVVVTDTLPAGVTFSSATSSQGSCSGTGTRYCNLGNIANGASATVTIVVIPTVAGTLSNTAIVDGAQNDPNSANNAATATTTVMNTQISTCTNILSPGVYRLNNDIIDHANTCINITSSNVIFDGADYTIDGIDALTSYGVYVYNSTTILTNVTVINLKVTDWEEGIFYLNTHNGRIANNTANSNTIRGIFVLSSSNNTLTSNIASNNSLGIYILYSSNTTLIGNTANSNPNYGINLGHSSNSTLSGSNASNNSNGIYLGQTSNSTLSGNNASNNLYGIFLRYSSNNNILSGNNASNNFNGILLDSSSNNKIYNNFFSNTNNFWMNDSNVNAWNITRTPGINIIGGLYLGGNFWANPDGTGFGQTCADVNRDGICDPNYVLASGNVDYLPLAISLGNISACSTISSPGEYLLNQNILDSGASSCINITSSNVIFDGADYTIDGQNLQNSYGIYVNSATVLTNVTVKNLKVTDWSDGIYYKNIQNGSIANNTANSNNYGIYLYSSSNNTLNGNNASNNDDGIDLDYSSNNKLSGNTVSNNAYTGIFLPSSSNNTLINNNVNSNNKDGIDLEYSNNNNLTGNNVSNNMFIGIHLLYSSNNNLTGNNASNNDDGIDLKYSANNTLSSNNANSNNNYGIYLYFSSNNALMSNNASSNNFRGILLAGSSNNKIYNNIFNNTNNFEIASSSSIAWNTTKTSDTNVLGGPYIGGNFWANPIGKGFSQTCPDVGRDGICDKNYTLVANNIDYMPLTIPAGYSYISGQVMNNSIGIANAVVTTNIGNTTNTDASGFYSMLVPAGTFNLTAMSAPRFYTNSSIILTVVARTTVIQDIELLKKQTGNISGSVSK